jgi:hypothetical protein
MLNDMLAKMASKMKGEDTGSEISKINAEGAKPMPMDNTQGAEPDPDERYKAGAVFGTLKAKLQDALRAKDPEKYDAYMNGYLKIRDEGVSLLKAGKIDEYKNKMKELTNYGEKGQLDTYLTPEEMKKTLGKDYEPFIKSAGTVMKTGYDVTKTTNVVGEKETPESVNEINFGKRFLIQPSSAGEEATTTSGKKLYAKFYKYNPQTQQAEIDKDKTYGQK